jgi:hypothetical protein
MTLTSESKPPTPCDNAPPTSRVGLKTPCLASTAIQEEDGAHLAAIDGVFSSDLVQLSKQHVDFLRALHRSGITLSKPSDESVRRYSELWLPFIAKYPTHQLIPPGDVAWLWHCHRLAPYKYLSYVRDKFCIKGNNLSSSSPVFFLDPSNPFEFQVQGYQHIIGFNEGSSLIVQEWYCDATIELFQKMYPNENFFLDDDCALQSSSGTSKLGGFDVAESCERQATFLWQVSQSKFSLDEFLHDGKRNYEKFARLAGSPNKPTYIVPTYQIDLMWHTHILASIEKYHHDHMNLTGRVLPHDDSLNDRTEGGELDTNFQATKKLWSETYNEEYALPGGMYRGEPPPEFFCADWEPEPLIRAVEAVGLNSWMSIADQNAFIAARPKSTDRSNANPKKHGYVSSIEFAVCLMTSPYRFAMVANHYRYLAKDVVDLATTI